MKNVRLNKFLAGSGVASRRGADQMIADGRILLNGKVVTELATFVDPRRDKVLVDGRPVQSAEGFDYVVLNKPAGYITTVRDPEGRPTVMELVPDRKVRLYPVGRLDYDSEGLLFLMNDGPLAFRLTHPRYEVEKTYRVTLDSSPDEVALKKVRDGVTLDDGPTRPAEARLLRKGGRTLDMTLHEGRNRQVRRVFETLGFAVVGLTRIRFGTVELGDLESGRSRKMTRGEVNSLRKLVGLHS